MSNAVGSNALVRRRILVVEDEYFIADDMRRAITKLGGEVIGPVPTKELALDLLASTETVDAAVLDINLRGEVVYPVADALVKRGIPFVFATGYDVGSVVGSYAHVPRWEKPFNHTDLARALAALMR